MAFLGVDQSLQATGICVLSASCKVINLATIKPGKAKDGKRLFLIRQVIDTFLKDITFAALEGYSYASVGKVFELGEVGGVIKCLLTERDIPYISIPPTTLKKFATGTGSADKEKMLAGAKALGVHAANDNESDAFFLSRLARGYYLDASDLRHELEVIQSLKSPKITKPKLARLLRKIKTSF